MNKKGFTLIELLATLIVLGVVLAITLVSVNSAYKNARDKTEDVFVSTIKDAMEMYLSSDAKEIDSFGLITNNNGNACIINKSYGSRKIYKSTINFGDVINSKFVPLVQSELVNPANKEVECVQASMIDVTIYRDEDFVYYYSIDKDEFGCFKNSGEITNLPEGFECR